MIIQIATAAGENRGPHAEQSINSLQGGITAIFDCVLQKFQAARKA